LAILLGVDTGGTYTDAVLLQDEDKVLATAKALTTRHDLAVGIGEAIDAVLRDSGVLPGQIAMASLSTTLATNALVEGQGGRVALVSIGFDEADLKRQGLEDSLKGDPVIKIKGGHGHAGHEAHPLDLAELKRALQSVAAGVSGFAVASHFATRNPAHEIAARDLIIAETGKPVSCSHELSAKLNGPKRAMTAVLNARLIGMIDHLISAAEGLLKNRGIDAPLMVVRGDGALVSSAMARLKPIETILSGPAASLVGARWLTGETDALVSDIGGTTTDVAVLRDGRPKIDPMGARVGAFRTMVEAVAMRTTGLGGDSQVHIAREGLTAGVFLGPRRLMPISLCAVTWPDLVLRALERQMALERIGDMDGQFVMPVLGRDRTAEGLSDREQRILERIGGQAQEMGLVVSNRMELSALDRLVSRGLVMMSGITPSDASHVLGTQDGWNAQAADLALALFARKRTGAGNRLADGSQTLAKMIVDQLTHQTVEALLTVAFSEDGNDWGGLAPEALARHILVREGLGHHRGLMSIDAGLNLPLVGLGASAPNYYVAVGKRLNTKMILPEHAGVANALGAVVGQISMRLSGTITSPSEGRFRVHFTDGPQDYSSADAALDALETDLKSRATDQARQAGAEDVRVTTERDIRQSDVEGRAVFVEAEIRVAASGRPRIAEG
jgi:N-methylhydantoinase A/oxoprolinase/acetone carboxylase beta subunit